MGAPPGREILPHAERLRHRGLPGAGGAVPGFMIMASHSDSPALKVKEHPEITVEGTYRKLNVELYGGALLAPWFDRPLSVAGRLFLRTAEGVRPCLVDAGRDLVLIPSLAIHMNREVNAGYEYRVQRDLLPLYGGAEARDLTALLAREAARTRRTCWTMTSLSMTGRPPASGEQSGNSSPVPGWMTPSARSPL